MRYLSICSGIEAASVAWGPLGWQALGLSEIEPFPRAVLTHHYPDVPLHGDFTELRHQPSILDADALVGGTPCQAFSVAGLRNSLADDRGNLSLEFVRLADAIDDIRSAAGRDPAIIVWENVPGVLSVKDNAFGCFLAALAGDASPYVPPRGKWTNAGVVAGPARTVAWIVKDAQYFGVAQRRRRVFVVASARAGFDPAAVLFECEGMRRDTPPRREAGQGTTHATAPCLTSSGRGVERTGDTRGQDPVVAVAFGGNNTAGAIDVATAVNAHGGPHGRLDFESETFVAAYRTTGNDGVYETGEIVHALTTNTDPNSHVIGFSSKDHGADATEDLSPTLRAMPHHGSHANGGGQMAVAVPLQEVGKRTGVSTDDPRAGIGIGQDGDPMFTLQAGAQHGVAMAVSLRGREGGATAELGDEVQNCLRASQGGGDKPHVLTSMAVRRLTPVECSRLQGFPDDYLLSVTWRGKCPPPDGPMYKALGNSMAVPIMAWIGRRIAAEMARNTISTRAA